MSKWFDIQLNDSNSIGANDKQTSPESKSGKSVDQSVLYRSNGKISHCFASDANPIKCDDNCDHKKRLQSKDRILSSPSLSQNQSSNERQFDFESTDIRGLKDRRISLLVDELLNDIYCNLRSYRNRNLSCSSDTSNYSTPDLQKKPVFKDIYLKGKGMPFYAIVSHSMLSNNSVPHMPFICQLLLKFNYCQKISKSS